MSKVSIKAGQFRTLLFNCHFVDFYNQNDLATHRGIADSSVVSHLSEAAEAGLPLDIRRTGLTEATQKLITEAIRAPPINSGMQNCLCECYCIMM